MDSKNSRGGKKILTFSDQYLAGDPFQLSESFPRLKWFSFYSGLWTPASAVFVRDAQLIHKLSFTSEKMLSDIQEPL